MRNQINGHLSPSFDRKRSGAMRVLTIIACLGVLLLSTGVIKRASAQDIEKFNRFVRAQNSSDASARVLREGRDLISDENWEQAVKKFQGFITTYTKDPNLDAALYWLAFSQTKLKKYVEAQEQLQRLLKKYPNSNWADDARALQAQIAANLGDDKQIYEVLDKNKNKDGKDYTWKRSDRADDDEEIKIVALQSLFQSNPERGMAYVSNMLKPGSNASRKMKEAGIELVRRYGGTQTVQLLIDIIRNEQDGELRAAAIHALGRTGDERAFDVLTEMVRNSPDDEVSKAAVFAISRYDSPRAATVLMEMARSAKSREVRKEAIFWLSNRGDAVLNDLLSIYSSEPDTEVKKQIVFALRRIGSPAAIAKLYEIATGNGDVEVRKDAIHWIGQRGDEQAVGFLIRTYDAEKNEEIKNQIIFALSRTKEKSALRKLMEIARNDASIELRKQAVFWLGRSDDPDAAKFLEDILK